MKLRAVISDDVRRQLDATGLQQLLNSLWPVDCQSCGKPLGGGPPVLRVVETLDFATAALHHRRCQSSHGVETGRVS